MEQYKHLIPELSEPQRLSDYLVGIFPVLPSRKGVKKAIKKGLVSVDGVTGTTGLFLQGGEEVIYSPEVVIPEKLPELRLNVCYEDDYLAIVEKPAGLLTSGNKWMTFANALPANLKRSQQADALVLPQPAHRLDYPTSGLILVGKTATSLVQLNEMFHNHRIKKMYYAITIGELPEKGKINTTVDGKTALTHFYRINRQPSARFTYLNLVELQPQTGRRHQLRIHLASLACPILGDKQYGIDGLILNGKGLYLHARKLTFDHPVTGQLVEVETALPKKFGRIFSD